MEAKIMACGMKKCGTKTAKKAAKKVAKKK